MVDMDPSWGLLTSTWHLQENRQEECPEWLRVLENVGNFLHKLCWDTMSATEQVPDTVVLSGMQRKGMINSTLLELQKDPNKQGHYTCVGALLSALGDFSEDADANEFVIFMLAVLLKSENPIFEISRFHCDKLLDVSTHVQNGDAFLLHTGCSVLVNSARNYIENININWYTCMVLLSVQNRTVSNSAGERICFDVKTGFLYMPHVLLLAVQEKSYGLAKVAIMLLDVLQDTHEGSVNNRAHYISATLMYALVGIMQYDNKFADPVNPPDYTTILRCIKIMHRIVHVENTHTLFEACRVLEVLCAVMISAYNNTQVQEKGTSLLLGVVRKHPDMTEYIAKSGAIPALLNAMKGAQWRREFVSISGMPFSEKNIVSMATMCIMDLNMCSPIMSRNIAMTPGFLDTLLDAAMYTNERDGPVDVDTSRIITTTVLYIMQEMCKISAINATMLTSMVTWNIIPRLFLLMDGFVDNNNVISSTIQVILYLSTEFAHLPDAILYYDRTGTNKLRLSSQIATVGKLLNHPGTLNCNVESIYKILGIMVMASRSNLKYILRILTPSMLVYRIQNNESSYGQVASYDCYELLYTLVSDKIGVHRRVRLEGTTVTMQLIKHVLETFPYNAPEQTLVYDSFIDLYCTQSNVGGDIAVMTDTVNIVLRSIIISMNACSQAQEQIPPLLVSNAAETPNNQIMDLCTQRLFTAVCRLRTLIYNCNKYYTIINDCGGLVLLYYLQSKYPPILSKKSKKMQECMSDNIICILNKVDMPA